MQKRCLAFGIALTAFAVLADQENVSKNKSKFSLDVSKTSNNSTRRERSGRSKGILLVPTKDTKMRTLPKVFLTAGVATQTQIKGGGGGGGWGGGGHGGGGWGGGNIGHHGGGGGGWGGGGGGFGGGGSHGGGGWGHSGGGGGWGGGGGLGGGGGGWGNNGGGGGLGGGWGGGGGGGGGGWGWGQQQGGWGSGGGGGGGWSSGCLDKKAAKAAQKAVKKALKAQQKAQKKAAKGGGGGVAIVSTGGGGWGGSGGGGGGGWGGGGGGWRKVNNGWSERNAFEGVREGWNAEVERGFNGPPSPQVTHNHINEGSNEDEEWPNSPPRVSRVYLSAEEESEVEPRTYDMLEAPLPILLSVESVNTPTRYSRKLPAVFEEGLVSFEESDVTTSGSGGDTPQVTTQPSNEE